MSSYGFPCKMLAVSELKKLTCCRLRKNTQIFLCKCNYSTHSTHALSNPTNPNKSTSFLVYCNSQITKNGRKGNLAEAESIFNRMPNKTIITWTAMLMAYADNNQIAKARKLFDEMPQRNTATWNAMITTYIRNNLQLSEASRLFWTMPERNYITYAAMITGFARAGMLHEAEEVYNETPRILRDPAASNALIYGYLKIGKIDEAAWVFGNMVERDVVSWSSMIDGYCKDGRINEARELFRNMPERNVVSWTAMISGYMKAEQWEKGFGLFMQMRRDGGVEVNSTTLTVIFQGCNHLGKYEEGMQIHGLVISMGYVFDVFLGNSMISMYCSFGLMGAANKIFDIMKDKDVVSWNSLVTGYIQNGDVERAYRLFKKMPNKDVVSQTAIIAGLSTEGRMGECVALFNEMPRKDNVAWTAIISGFVGNGKYEKAFRWFINMLGEGIRPDIFTLNTMLCASAGLATLDKGEQVHVHVVKMDTEFDVSIQNSLVSMYAKCGNVDYAYRIFKSIGSPNVVSMNSMITGFAHHGLAEEALHLFRKMRDEGHEPNEITFLGVLSACAHAGLIKEGLDYFRSMNFLYGIEPGPDHYACMVDLLGRAGLLQEALNLIYSMPCKPHQGVWGALLSASKTYMDLDLAKLAATHLFKIEPENATTYAVLSNMYSILGLKKDEEVLRMAVKAKGVKKTPGWSWL